jgi:hypothetical protein
VPVDEPPDPVLDPPVLEDDDVLPPVPEAAALVELVSLVEAGLVELSSLPHEGA